MSKRRELKSNDNRPSLPDPSTMETLPITQQDFEELIKKYKDIDLFKIRVETIKRIEKITGNTLLCYVTQTSFLPQDIPYEFVSIADNDVEGFDTLIGTALSNAQSKNIDILFVSNGGSPEAAERIVRLLRENFSKIRFIVSANAFSAATMMSFACDEILMTDRGTLGPIDPQINGIPARTILRGFEDLERRMKEEGPEALTAYIDLLRGYSLHLLEICKSAEALAKELAVTWLSNYMLKCSPDDERVSRIVNYFADYDKHKSHGRSIGRQQAIDLGLPITKIQRGTSLDTLTRSLTTQYSEFFRLTDFYKVYENAYGTGWGLRLQTSPYSQPLIPKL